MELPPFIQVMAASPVLSVSVLALLQSPDGVALRGMAPLLRDVVAGYPWWDTRTYVREGQVRRWRACFPAAAALMVEGLDRSNDDGGAEGKVDGDAGVTLEGVRHLELMNVLPTDAVVTLVTSAAPTLQRLCIVESVAPNLTAEVLATMQALQVLELDGSAVGGLTVRSLIEYLPRLHHCSLRRSSLEVQLTGGGASSMVAALEACKPETAPGGGMAVALAAVCSVHRYLAGDGVALLDMLLRYRASGHVMLAAARTVRALLDATSLQRERRVRLLTGTPAAALVADVLTHEGRSWRGDAAQELAACMRDIAKVPAPAALAHFTTRAAVAATVDLMRGNADHGAVIEAICGAMRFLPDEDEAGYLGAMLDTGGVALLLELVMTPLSDDASSLATVCGASSALRTLAVTEAGQVALHRMGLLRAVVAQGSAAMDVYAGMDPGRRRSVLVSIVVQCVATVANITWLHRSAREDARVLGFVPLLQRIVAAEYLTGTSSDLCSLIPVALAQVLEWRDGDGSADAFAAIRGCSWLTSFLQFYGDQPTATAELADALTDVLPACASLDGEMNALIRTHFLERLVTTLSDYARLCFGRRPPSPPPTAANALALKSCLRILRLCVPIPLLHAALATPTVMATLTTIASDASTAAGRDREGDLGAAATLASATLALLRPST